MTTGSGVPVNGWTSTRYLVRGVVPGDGSGEAARGSIVDRCNPVTSARLHVHVYWCCNLFRGLFRGSFRVVPIPAAANSGTSPRSARTEITAVNANDATLTSLATAQTGSTVADAAPNAPANPGFDLVLHAVAAAPWSAAAPRSPRYCTATHS